jgi:hypothetical protein
MENKLGLSVKPDIEKYKDRIAEINSSILVIVDNAMIDFLMVNSVFKKYNEAADPSKSGDDAKRVSLSIKELQYVDYFSQKLDHVRKLNQGISEAVINNTNQMDGKMDHAGFVFKLNYLQTTVAANEFSVNASGLRQNLYELHDHIVSVTKLNFHENAYFKNLTGIEEKLKHVKHLLNEIQKERFHEAPGPLTAGEYETKNISDLYTMTSERYVLLWLLKYPQADAAKLLKHYRRDGYAQIEEEIELF